LPPNIFKGKMPLNFLCLQTPLDIRLCKALSANFRQNQKCLMMKNTITFVSLTHFLKRIITLYSKIIFILAFSIIPFYKNCPINDSFLKFNFVARHRCDKDSLVLSFTKTSLLVTVAVAGLKPLTSGWWGECSTTVLPPLASVVRLFFSVWVITEFLSSLLIFVETGNS
jgi:hypothetical protein